MTFSDPLRGACLVAFVGVLGNLACSAYPSSEDVTSTESELRALRADEIVGTLRFGETSSPVGYSEVPLYRAFRFDAKAGDAVDIWVRSSTGDARAWLLSPTFSTLSSNDNAGAETRDAHLKRTLTRSGGYYIAFRDANREENTFTVSLAQAATSCPSGQTRCGSECADLNKDLSHCGTCNNPCAITANASSAVCAVGVCDVVCAEGYTKGSGGCVANWREGLPSGTVSMSANIELLPTSMRDCVSGSCKTTPRPTSVRLFLQGDSRGALTVTHHPLYAPGVVRDDGLFISTFSTGSSTYQRSESVVGLISAGGKVSIVSYSVHARAPAMNEAYDLGFHGSATGTFR